MHQDIHALISLLHLLDQHAKLFVADQPGQTDAMLYIPPWRAVACCQLVIARQKGDCDSLAAQFFRQRFRSRFLLHGKMVHLICLKSKQTVPVPVL